MWIVGLVYLLLSFPSGRLQGRLDRWLVVGGLAVGFGLQVVAMLYGNKAGLRCSGCANNVIQVFHDNQKALNWLGLQRLVGIVLIVTVIVLLVERWLRAGAAQQRAVAPVLVAGCATLAALGVDGRHGPGRRPAGLASRERVLHRDGDRAGRRDVRVAAAAAGARHGRGARRRAGRTERRRPTCGRRSPGRWATRRSSSRTGSRPRTATSTATAPRSGSRTGDSGRSATFVERDGQPIAVLVHDPVLEHNAELVQSVCAAASLALENERLQAELRARLVELQASRARLVEATDAERRRIERDLHDGTQQRLVSIAMSLGLLETKLPADATAAQPIVRETREALALALEELRELTHGINPPLLTERGLSAALDELCRRAPLPARLDVSVDRRLPDEVESAAYFIGQRGADQRRQALPRQRSPNVCHL